MARDKVVLVALLMGGLILLPAIVTRTDVLNLLLLVFIAVTLAESWNILSGYAGQINLGHAAFFGLGSLVTRLLWISGEPLPPSFLAGGIAAVAFALVIGAPAFRLKGIYFAIGTLGLAEIMRLTVGNVLPIVSTLPSAYVVTYDIVPRYYVSLGLALLTAGTTYLLIRSRWGLGVMAVRESEEAAEAIGVNTFRHKLLALSLSAFFAGLAGGAFAFYHVSYYYQFPFSPVWTFDALLITFVGGVGTLVGPIVGALFYVIVKELLAIALVEIHPILFGGLFIVVILLLPGGLVEVGHRTARWATQFLAARG